MQSYGQKKSLPVLAVMAIAICVIALAIYYCFAGNTPDSVKKPDSASGAAGDGAGVNATSPEATVDLAPSQLKDVKIETVGTYEFHMRTEALGSVAYHEKDAGQGSASAPGRTSKFVVVNVPESASPLVQAGQSIEAKFAAYPGRVFKGKVVVLGVTLYDSGGNPAIDPNTHRITVRCEIEDSKNELYPGMLATVAIEVGKPVESAAIPVNGVVRKGDGTMTAWVTKDRKRFEERTITVGVQQNGFDQILEGLKPDELVATDGAIFISNILYASPSD